MKSKCEPNESDREILLVVCLWLGSQMQSAFYPQSIMIGLEMIGEFAKHLPFK